MVPLRASRLVLASAVLAGFTAAASAQTATPATQANTEPAHAAAGDTGQSRNAARSRMRECGHQWSSMKKNGSAAGMTWKDFSQGCLAKQ